MHAKHWILAGALLCGLGVVSGAFGAHALRSSLEAADQLENWRTAVRYQVWHGLALLALAPTLPAAGRGRPVLALFVTGTLLFSGSIYGLALGGPGSLLGPITPIGGLLLISGWALVAISGFRSRS
ncbi:MAG: DUF423 domain-containing protein [Planctomycetota bacterium]